MVQPGELHEGFGVALELAEGFGLQVADLPIALCRLLVALLAVPFRRSELSGLQLGNSKETLSVPLKLVCFRGQGHELLIAISRGVLSFLRLLHMSLRFGCGSQLLVFFLVLLISACLRIPSLKRAVITG